MDKKKLEKLKQRVEKFREKHKNAQKDVKGVKHPNRSHKQAKAQKRQPKAVGPKGGVYTPTASGKKDYQKSMAGTKMDNKIQTFIEEQKMKKEEIKKAVTAAAAPATTKADDATLNGENKPAIQDAKTQTQIQQEAAKPAETPAPAAAAPATPEPPKEVPKKEVSFDGLFANDYAIGSTLRQNPNGGNIMSNMKKPSMDYVERAKNHKNVSMSSEELAQVKPPVVQTKPKK